ncbi:MAG: serine--tRNA ligase [Leptospirales bacterium]|nr:serine--tRNA ligase [Leptospirales bacterium]
MLDLRLIQDKPEALDEMLRRRRSSGVDVSELKSLIAKNRKLLTELNDQRAVRNAASKEIGALLGKGKKDEAEARKAEVKSVGERIAALESEQGGLEEKMNAIVLGLPNWLDDSTPDGDDASANVLVREVGKKPAFDFQPQAHYEIGVKLGWVDFEAGVRLAGSRFYVYRDGLARLERALISFMLDLHTQKAGYSEAWVPILINDDGMVTTGQFPKFRGEYYTLERDQLSLIPTAEVPLVNLYRDTLLSEDQLPVRLTAASSCFRRESGAAGKDTRGLVRVHQFQKVELVQLVRPEDSERVHEEMLGHAEEVLKRLALPYRVVQLCSGDIGATAARTYDIEVWMPGLDRWLEISSVSNCRDFQARRGGIRYKGKGAGAKSQFVHTLNGSGVAAGRCMIAIMENYQRADGSFGIPAALQPYMQDRLT